MESGRYGRLEQLIDKAIAQITRREGFDLGDFIDNVDAEFKRLGFHEQTARGVEKILLIRLDAVGDFILTSPALRAIRENAPTAHITLIVSKAVYPMAEFCPYVDKILSLDTNFDKEDIFQVTKHISTFARENFWKERYDLALGFLPDFRHMLMAYLSGANKRMGYVFGTDKELLFRQFFFNMPVLLDYSKFIHQCERNLYLLQSVGFEIPSSNIEVWFTEKDLKRAKKFLNGFAPNRLKVAVGIGATIPERRYPVEKYLAAFKEIIAKGAAIVILGGPSERDDAKFLEENLPKKFVKNIVALNPTWRVTSAVIALVNMYIGNDTGTQHVAAALKKPVIVLSRDSKDHTRVAGRHCEHIGFYPWQTQSIVLLPEHSLGDCAKDLNSTCWAGNSHCITQIEPAEIVAAYDKMVSATKLKKA